MVAGCTLGSTPKATSAPGKAAIVSWLRELDRNGVDFTVTSRITGGPLTSFTAAGHEKDGEIDMTSGSARLLVYDGVLYGAPTGASKWIEMRAEPVDFLWPAAALSLVWEAILLSRDAHPAFRLGADQTLELAGALGGARGEVRVPNALGRIEVVLNDVDSIFTPRGPNPAAVQPPATAAQGNVLTLLAPGTTA